ncbi:putative ABC transporter ATP-binding protein YfiB [Paenibacillus antibioticophila]|uniref:ABC transporter ATP-binding protein YfiB n=1 Tax=Paenibacillus antibioticophila TaxID=1274374 RepID=A0A920CF95_9BACL|nr:ABC transporter ATP-binding protein [Paenibacillus antibioticophila]GIO37961.1 putative ABC transporter ATP-binding protein YfiB [Paenibacillus antibioticophila]
MRTVLSFLRKYRVAACAALAMMLIELSVELIQPLIISRIIDEGIAVKDLNVVWLWGGILLVSAGIAFVAGLASSFFASHASQGFGFDLRDRLYEKVQSLSYPVFGRFATSSLITRLTGDVTQLQDMVFMGLRFATRVPLVVFGSMIMAIVVHGRLGLMLAVLTPLVVWFVLWMINRTSARFGQVQKQMDAVNGVIQENMTGMRLIRVFVRRNQENERFRKRSGELMQGTVSALRLSETTTPVLLLMMNAGILAVLWFGKIDIAAGNASIGQVVAVVNYALRTVGALSALSWIMASYSRASASAARTIEVLGTEDPSEEQWEEKPESSRKAVSNRMEKKPEDDRMKGEVEFSRVSFSYPGSDLKVLEDISFHVRPGERVAILGATGSGKSSLVQLIPGLYEPTGGDIAVDGKKIGLLGALRLRSGIGYVPQEVILFSGSVRDNIAWGREDATFEEIQEAARQAQIHETILSLPQGYDTMLGQRGVNLSGGQKQRLSIARALVRRPAILILDDSTSALDTRTEAALLMELDRLSCTTFLITQKVSSTVSADLILLLDEGHLIACGKHEELLADSPLYRRIAESQQGGGDRYVQSAH